MHPKIQLPHELTWPVSGTDQETALPQAADLTGGMPVDGFLAMPDMDLDPPLQGNGSKTCVKETYEKVSYDRYPQPDPWWHAISAAVTWTKDVLIEGFAAYGAAMEPGFFQPYGLDDADGRSPDDTMAERLRDHEATASPVNPHNFAKTEAPPTTASRWTALITSPLAGVLGNRPRVRRTREMISDLKDMDERTRRDIGYLHYETD